MRMKNLTAILFILYLLPATMAVSAPRIETLKVGKDSFYFRDVRSTAIEGLSSALADYQGPKIVVFLCANGDSKHLIKVMKFLEDRGFTEVTLTSSPNAPDC